MISEDKITEIFCLAVDFCKLFDKLTMRYSIGSSKPSIRRCFRDSRMNVSEIIVIFMDSNYTLSATKMVRFLISCSHLVTWTTECLWSIKHFA